MTKITQEEAAEIAQTYVEEAARRSPHGLRGHLPIITGVYSATEAIGPIMAYRLSTGGKPSGPYWVAHLRPDLTILTSSLVVVLTQSSGEVVYFGPSGDEG